MIRFRSARVRSVNSERAIEECLDIAFPNGGREECGAVIVNAALGHRLDRLGDALRRHLPNAFVTGSSCCGVVGREGVGESMHEVAIMCVCGDKKEYAVSSVRDIYGHNAYEKGLELAQGLRKAVPGASAAYLLCPGIDIANDLVIKAFDEVFCEGEGVTLFGGTSSDNMRGLITMQYHDETRSEHDAWVVGFADPSLKVVTRAAHGFTAYGEPMVVTKAEGHRIIELNGRPAWSEYLLRLELPEDAHCGDSIPIGALAEELPPRLAEEYGNGHILRVVTKFGEDGVMYYPVTCGAGLKLWLTQRDEELIFSEQQRALGDMKAEIRGGHPVAVFQTDCLARGRFLFNKVVKDELIAMMQDALSTPQGTPAWLGMYGFGEYAYLGGRNAYHNYSSALAALYR